MWSLVLPWSYNDLSMLWVWGMTQHDGMDSHRYDKLEALESGKILVNSDRPATMEDLFGSTLAQERNFLGQTIFICTLLFFHNSIFITFTK